LATAGIENLGPLRPTQIAGLLERSDVFLDFSTWQALGLTALEAMASGCAVVVPRLGGTAAFARDGENALLCDTDDADACREVAVRLVADNELRRRLRRAAIDEAARHPPEGAASAILHVLFGDWRGT
jgi:glycosyltransferase involved in cell wall biosynthesis